MPGVIYFMFALVHLYRTTKHILLVLNSASALLLGSGEQGGGVACVRNPCLIVRTTSSTQYGV